MKRQLAKMIPKVNADGSKFFFDSEPYDGRFGHIISQRAAGERKHFWGEKTVDITKSFAKMLKNICEIFAECQKHSAVHKSNVKKLTALIKDMSQKEVEAALELILRGILDQCLLVSKKEAAVERVMKFFCDFLAASVSNLPDDKVFRAGMDHLLRRSLAADKNIRYRTCQSLSFVLATLHANGAEVSEDIWQSVVSVIVPRLKDKAPNVRMWAVKTLANLQNPLDESDPVILEFIRLMNSDTAPAVRVAAVDKVAIVKKSLTSLVARVQDIKPEVRIAALERLAANVSVGNLSSTQRATIAIFGLADRDDGCRNVAVGLIQKWATTLDNNVPKLLQLMNMKTNVQAVELVANTLIGIVENPGANPFPASIGLKAAVRDARPQWETKDMSRIPGSEILWAQLRCDYARKNFPPSVAEATIEHLVPDTVDMCGLLASAHAMPELEQKVSLQISMRNLLHMTSFMDAADVSGGQELARVCECMLIDVRLPDSLVDSVLDAWLRGLGKIDSSAIFANITALSEKFGAMLEADDANELEEGVLEMLAATRGLQLVNWALALGINDSDSNRRLSDTFYQFAIESLQSTSPDMRRLAVRCIGLMGLCSEASCAKNREILLQVVAQDLEEVQVREQALKALVDMATVHSTLFADHPVLTGLLLRVMEDSLGHFTTVALRRVAAEASAKLLFQGTVSEPKLFAELLKLFFVPEMLHHLPESNEDSDEPDGAVARLQQLLSVFMRTFYFTSESNRQVTLDSIEHIVRDVSVMCRDGVTPASVVSKVAALFLDMSEQVLPSVASSGSGKSQSATESWRASCCVRLASVILREALKLGNSKNEKATVKELIKVLSGLSPHSYGWAASAMAATAFKAAKCVARNCALDKTTKTALDRFICACAKEAISARQVMDSSSRSRGRDENIKNTAPLDDSAAYALYEKEEEEKRTVGQFYAFAPGLADLVELIASDDDSDAELAAYALLATTIPAAKGFESESDSDEGSEEEHEERPAAKQKRAAKVTTAAFSAVASTESHASAPLAEVLVPEKVTRKRAPAKSKNTTIIESENELPKTETSSKKAVATKSKSTSTRGKITKAVEEEPVLAASRPRRARATKTYTDAGSDEDMENINPQEV